MIPFTVQEPPKLPPLISIVIEKPKEEETKPPVTWRDNPQACNEDTHYIAAEEPFYCILKAETVHDTTLSQKAVKSTVKSLRMGINWYPVGQCTWWVATKRPVGAWNDATDWLWQAQRDGWTISDLPVKGAIAWRVGHVAFVEAVNGDMMTISEANYDYKGSIRTITIPISNYSKYIY